MSPSLFAGAVSLIRPAVGLAVLGGYAPQAESSQLLLLILFACSTDWLDGEVARVTRSASVAGRVVDNLCDFAFLLCLFVFFARLELWSPPVWGQLLRHSQWANWAPAFALVASFGLYFVRLLLEIRSGGEPGRSPRGHVAGVANYVLVIVGAAEMHPDVDLAPRLLESSMAAVVLLNAIAVVENLLLMFHRQRGGPRMPA